MDLASPHVITLLVLVLLPLPKLHALQPQNAPDSDACEAKSPTFPHRIGDSREEPPKCADQRCGLKQLWPTCAEKKEDLQQELSEFPAAIDDFAADSWKFVERRGKQFAIDGSPFYVNGFNTYWLMLLAADDTTRPKIARVFKDAAAQGLTVCRTWAFNDGGWRALQSAPGVYDEKVFRALDFVVAEARKHGIRLILTLSNNWDAFGGRTQYLKWANLSTQNPDLFFSHPTVIAMFKAHVTAVLTRRNTFTNTLYKDDPTIMAWELMNEPRCPSDTTGDTLYSWISQMALHVKSVDARHLLTTGLEGFYGPTSASVSANPNTYASQVGTDFIRHHSAFGIDFASAHIYSDSWVTANVISAAHIAWVRTWTGAHIRDADSGLGMPVLFGEFGVSERDGGYNVSLRNAFFQSVYESVLESVRVGGAGAGSLLWQVFPEGVDYMNDGYAIVLSGNGSAAGSTLSLISRQSFRLSTFNSLCNYKCHWGCKKPHPHVSLDVDTETGSPLTCPSTFY